MRNRIAIVPILILFALCWSMIILLIDGSIGHDCYQQYASGKFPSVTGTITHSEDQAHKSRKGDIYHTAVINYRYEVGGQTFLGDKLAFGETARLIDATTIVNTHPVGSVVHVYYNPNKPNESVLYPGLAYIDFGWVLALTPFNIVMIGFWIWIGGWLRLKIFKPAAGGMKIITNGMTTRVRLPRWNPIWWALATTGGLGFISVFTLPISGMFKPSMELTWPSIFIIYMGGVSVYAWRHLKANSGDEDLIINEVSGTLELPLTFGRKERVTVGFGDIEALWIETIVRSGPKGTSYSYAPTLNIRRNKLGKQKLAEWSDELRAADFVEWLYGKIDIPSRPNRL